MNNHKNSTQFMRRYFSFGNGFWLATVMLLSGLMIQSCQKEEEIVILMGKEITLSVSSSELILSQRNMSQKAISLNWTRGTNHGTGSSISYVLEIDKAGNDFTSAKVYAMGKGVFEKSFTVSALNELVRTQWGIAAGTPASFEARVKADVTLEDVEDGITAFVSFTVTPYEPVSEVLYMVGDATPNGWNISNATQMTASASAPWVFVYQGPMSAGSFKFAVSQDGCWCQNFYTKDPDDDELMVYNQGGSGDDIQWQIEQGGNYKITVDLLDLKIGVKQLSGPMYTNLYIVGDASPSGWNIGSPEAFVQDSDDPFTFTYEANFSPGDFKISTFTGDWCDGEWFNPSQADQVLTATDFIITNGCDGPDNKWRVTEDTKGRYNITVNTGNGIIKIEKVMLYLIGDAGPNGWNIGTPEPMTLAGGIYTFTGALTAGEFKFSKYKGDWCDGDWIIAATANQPVTNKAFKVRHGCQGDDNKWRVHESDAGNYVITFDLDNEVMTITKQ